MTRRTIVGFASVASFWIALQFISSLVPLGTQLGIGGAVDSVLFAQRSDGSAEQVAEADGESTDDVESSSDRSSALSDSQTLSESVTIDATDVFTFSESLSQTISIESESTPAVSTGDSPAAASGQSEVVGSAADGALLGVVDGTILANRTELSVRFFVEGQTFELGPLRSIGLDLPRASGVLNLYNCNAATAESVDTCYWDPYMIDREGFYEVISGLEIGRAVELLLQEVGGPEGPDIWIQNRSTAPEVVVYRNQVYDLQPGAIREFSVGDDALPTFFLRSCLEVNGQSACEWAPVVAKPGGFYTLEEVETIGGLPASQVTMLRLSSISGGDEESVETPIAVKQVQCSLLVPALNVRSGPGLEYQIIAKIRGSETVAATVLIIGRSATSEWVAVDERVAPGGWITGSPNFITCENSLLELDEIAVTDGRLAPTPEPVAEVAPAPEPVDVVPDVPSEESADGEIQDEIAEAATPEPIEIPEGQALLIVNNGFDHDIRFTLDQKYRVEQGPSEIDLQPGDTVNVFVIPGMIGFSASTPFRTLSRNADFFIDQEQSQVLWLAFAPDPDGSGEFLLQY